MKFQLGGMQISVDISQLLNGNGATIHINGEIRPGLQLSAEVSYLPVSMEKLNIEIRVTEIEVKDA